MLVLLNKFKSIFKEKGIHLMPQPITTMLQRSCNQQGWWSVVEFCPQANGIMERKRSSGFRCIFTVPFDRLEQPAGARN